MKNKKMMMAMKKVMVIVAWFIGLTIMSDVQIQPVYADDEFMGSPVLTTVPSSERPKEIPPGTYSRCSSGPCQVIQWGGLTYWILEYTDNSSHAIVAAYNDQNELVSYKIYSGARYISQIVMDEGKQTFKLIGQSQLTIEFPWDDLYRMTSTTISVSANPVPGGESVTITATVEGIKENISGEVEFNYNSHTTSVALNAEGEASLTVSLPPGKHMITAKYLGDATTAASSSRDYFLLIDMEPSDTEPYIEYRSVESAPMSAPPGTRLNCVYAFEGNSSLCPVIVWGEYEFWFYKVSGISRTAVIVAAYDNAGILKGYSDPGTEDEEYSDSQYKFRYTLTGLYDVAIDPVNNQLILKGHWNVNVDSILIPLNEILILRNLMEETVTTLTVSPQTVIEGRKVTLHAEVHSGDELVPTGDVTFMSGMTELGTARLQDGVATLVVVIEPAGIHQITAKYSGSENFYEESVSAPEELKVEERTLAGEPEVVYVPLSEAHDRIPAGLSLNCDHRKEGDYTTYCATIQWGNYEYWVYYDPPKSSLHVVAYDTEGEPVGFRAYESSFSLIDITLDSAAQTVTLQGSQFFKTEFSWEELVDILASTRVHLTLTEGNEFIIGDEEVQLTAHVAGPEPQLQGKIVFKQAGIPLTEPLDVGEDGTVQLKVPLSMPGKHVFTAHYIEDRLYFDSDSNMLTVVVQGAPMVDSPYVIYKPDSERPQEFPDHASLNCYDNPLSSLRGLCPTIQYGDFTYWVYDAGNNDVAMIVAAYDPDGKLLGSKRYNGARYLYDISIDHDGGTETIYLWGQSNNFSYFNWADLTDMLTATTTTLQIIPNVVQEGTPVILTAVVEGYRSTITGTVTFLADETEIIGTTALNSEGVAELVDTVVEAGHYTVQAIYFGDEENDPSESEAVDLIVKKELLPSATSVTLSSSNSQDGWAKVGDMITLEFVASEAIQDVVVTMLGQPIVAEKIAGDVEHTWRAVYVLQEEDPEGEIEFTVDFEDLYGNKADQVKDTTDESTVIFDKDKPELILLGDPIVYHEALTDYDDAGAQAEDNMMDEEIITEWITVINNVDTSKLGIYEVKYDVQDMAGNQADELIRTVHVVDTTEPVITLNGDVYEYVSLGGQFDDPFATAWDNYDGDITAQMTVTGTVYTSKLGHYTITYRVTDSSGNVGIAQRIVEVIDDDRPIITLLGLVHFVLEVGETFVDPGAIAKDNADGDISEKITVTGVVYENQLGTYILEYNVKDSSGNQAITKFRTVEVVDTTPPIIELLGGHTVTLQVGQHYVEAGVQAKDNYDGDLTHSVVIAGAIDPNVPGEYKLTYSVEDSSRNKAEVTRTIFVVANNDDSDDDDDEGDGNGGNDDSDDKDGGNEDEPGGIDGDKGDGKEGGNDDKSSEDGSESDEEDNATHDDPDEDLNEEDRSNHSGNRSSRNHEETASSQSNEALDVFVNGKPESAGTVMTSEADGRTITAIVLDESKIEQRLDDEGEHTLISIRVATESDVIIGELTGQIVKQMETQQAIVEIVTDKATYKIPAQHLHIEEIADRFGSEVRLQDIKIQIEILTPQDEVVQFVEDSAASQGLAFVVPPLSFSVRAVKDEQVEEIFMFNAYVERLVAIPDDVDVSRITTGVYIGPDGSVHHVPTRIVEIDGKLYAQIYSLTNSMYSVVWNQVDFKDVEHHWSKQIVNDLGARLVLSGYEDGTFKPDQSITRAEFATILMRGLGLRPQKQAVSFADVSSSDWYHDVVGTAFTYGLIRGFEDGSFAANEFITREQAMVIISQAMNLTDLQAATFEQSDDELIRSFTDASLISNWAKHGIAASVRTGIVSGRGDGALAPKDSLSRAEAAVLIHRLLVRSGLIDDR